MEYQGTITAFNFSPMVELVDSILRITIDIPQLGYPIQVEETGTIDNLSKKFGITVNEREATYNFGRFEGRRCIVRRTENGYFFVRFID